MHLHLSINWQAELICTPAPPVRFPSERHYTPAPPHRFPSGTHLHTCTSRPIPKRTALPTCTSPSIPKRNSFAHLHLASDSQAELTCTPTPPVRFPRERHYTPAPRNRFPSERFSPMSSCLSLAISTKMEINK